jgi:hypothetical protein
MWPRFPGYLDVVKRAWHCPLRDTNPCCRLDWLLQNTARMLKSWSDKHIGNVRMQLEVAKEVVHRLEMARDRRTLAAHEESLRQRLKLKSLSPSSLQRSITHQESRLLWPSEGDAFTSMLPHIVGRTIFTPCRMKVVFWSRRRARPRLPSSSLTKSWAIHR